MGKLPCKENKWSVPCLATLHRVGSLQADKASTGNTAKNTAFCDEQ